MNDGLPVMGPPWDGKTPVQVSADLCRGIYAYAGDPKIPWDHYDDGSDSDGVCWGIAVVNGVAEVVFRGSTTPLDWFRDFELAALAVPDKDLGWVHPGFVAGMDAVIDEISFMLPKINWLGAIGDVRFHGHSLGATRAGIATGKFNARGSGNLGRIVWGEPKPGLADCAKLIAKTPGISFQNGDGVHVDPVTLVPFTLPPLEDYRHPNALTPVRCPPDASDPWGARFGLHHMPIYWRSAYAGGGA